MTTISNHAVHGIAPQRAESTNLDAPKATPLTTQTERLVMNAVQISQESAAIDEKLKKIAALEQQVKDLMKEHKGIKSSAFPTTIALESLEIRATMVRVEILRLQPNIANPEKLADLRMQRGTLQSLLNDGGQTAIEKRYMEAEIAWLDVSIERELFMADGSGSEQDFAARVGRTWALEIGTLRNAIHEGGLSPQETEANSRRIAAMEKVSQAIAEAFHRKDVLM